MKKKVYLSKKWHIYILKKRSDLSYLMHNYNAVRISCLHLVLEKIFFG